MLITTTRAHPTSAPLAFHLLTQAAAWLKSKSINYWQDWLNPSAAHIQWIESGFDNGEFYFAYNPDNILVGMYRLQFSDEIFWGKRDDKAGYIHSFTTNRDFERQGIGYIILNQIENELREKGYEYLRLDCSPNIKELCKQKKQSLSTGSY